MWTVSGLKDLALWFLFGPLRSMEGLSWDVSSMGRHCWRLEENKDYRWACCITEHEEGLEYQSQCTHTHTHGRADHKEGHVLSGQRQKEGKIMRHCYVSMCGSGDGGCWHRWIYSSGCLSAFHSYNIYRDIQFLETEGLSRVHSLGSLRQWSVGLTAFGAVMR